MIGYLPTNCYPGFVLGAARGVNPALNPVGGGDGIDDVCWLSLERLLRKYPQVKFLVTVLPREGQHRVCVLANKFRNLHLYGNYVLSRSGDLNIT